MSVCLSIQVLISETTSPSFTKLCVQYMLPVAVAKSTSDSVVIHHVLLILWMCLVFTPCALWHVLYIPVWWEDSITAKTTALISTKCYSSVKTSKYLSLVCTLGVKFAIYKCLVMSYLFFSLCASVVIWCDTLKLIMCWFGYFVSV